MSQLSDSLKVMCLYHCWQCSPEVPIIPPTGKTMVYKMMVSIIHRGHLAKSRASCSKVLRVLRTGRQSTPTSTHSSLSCRRIPTGAKQPTRRVKPPFPSERESRQYIRDDSVHNTANLFCTTKQGFCRRESDVSGI